MADRKRSAPEAVVRLCPHCRKDIEIGDELPEECPHCGESLIGELRLPIGNSSLMSPPMRHNMLLGHGKRI
jgi:DNA-directed RNA polymerase subunit RPC12/RpoP